MVQIPFNNIYEPFPDELHFQGFFGGIIIVIDRRFSMEEHVRYEEFKVDGDKLIAKIKEVLHEGNIRRIIVKNEKGETLIEIPLTIGVVGALLIPVWAALGAIAALAVNFTIVVEKVVPAQSSDHIPE
jgi:hypothetical protein